MSVKLECNLRTLIEAAARAPSGDNMQPWKFVVDADAGRIDFHVDESRDPSPMNAGQRMSRIAVGAAVENLVRCIKNRCDVEVNACSAGGAFVSVHLQEPLNNNYEPERTIHHRVTNRRQYDGRPLAPETLGALMRATPDREGIRIHWITERERLSQLSDLIGRADALMFGEPSMRHAFLKNVRFDLPANCEAEEGLPIGALELMPMDRRALTLLPRMPDWMFRLLKVKDKLSQSSCRLVNSASGICIVNQPALTPQMDIRAGRAMQSAWLAITSEGMFAQPMMSMVIFDNLFCQNALPASMEPAKVSNLLADFCDAIPEIDVARPAFIMRFGFASSPTIRTGRLHLEANTTMVSG